MNTIESKRCLRPRYGWLMVDMMVTLAVLLMLVGSLAAVSLSAGRANQILWTQQQAIAAVEAQLDCLTSTGVPLAEEEFKRLWPHFSVAVERMPGEDGAAGLERIEVTVTGRAKGKPIHATGCRYIPTRGES